MTPASWQPDPTGRSQFRWWDGTSWTSHVSTNGQLAEDPLTAEPPVAAVAAPAEPPAIVVPPLTSPAFGGPVGPAPAVAAKRNPLKIIVPVADPPNLPCT